MLNEAAAVRERLRNPPNACADQGIDLRRGKSGGRFGYPVAAVITPKKPSAPSWLADLVEFNEQLRHCVMSLRRPPPKPDDEPRTKVLASEIVVTVAQHYGVAIADLLSASRRQYLVVPRHIGMFLCHELTDLSLPQIGHAFRRDHTTVLHAVRVVSARMAHDYNLRMDIQRLMIECRGGAA